MSKNLEAKKGVVADIRDKFQRAQTVVLVDYRGLNVAEDTELRNQLRKAGVEYAVLKNTMINLAIADLGMDGVKAHLEDRPRSRSATRIWSPPRRSSASSPRSRRR